MTKRLLALLLVLVFLVATGCDTKQRAQGGEQRVDATARNARPTVSAELLAYRTREGGRLLEVLIGRSQSDRIIGVTRRTDNSSVRVGVTLDPGGEQDLMFDCVAFRLDEPLGERTVTNSATGRRVGQAKRGTERAALLPRTCAQRHPTSEAMRP